MALGVDHRDYFNVVGLKNEKQLVGKAPGQNASHILVQHRMLEGILSDGSKCCLNFGKELPTESGLAFFVPVKSLRHVSFGFGTNDEAMTHFRRETMRA